jgi:hypothetical protein
MPASELTSKSNRVATAARLQNVEQLWSSGFELPDSIAESDALDPFNLALSRH